jgi:hypothetical protein
MAQSRVAGRCDCGAGYGDGRCDGSVCGSDLFQAGGWCEWQAQPVRDGSGRLACAAADRRCLTGVCIMGRATDRVRSRVWNLGGDVRWFRHEGTDRFWLGLFACLGGGLAHRLLLASVSEGVDRLDLCGSRRRDRSTSADQPRCSVPRFWSLQLIVPDSGGQAFATDPTWSGDGRWIAYAWGSYGHRHVWLLRPDGHPVPPTDAQPRDRQRTQLSSCSVVPVNAEQVSAPKGGAWSRQAAWRTARRGEVLLTR